jgi:predicted dehydrogenase
MSSTAAPEGGLKEFRAGFVGAGFAARFHHESIREIESLGARPVGVFSQRPESRERFAAERGLKAYSSLESLLADVDVVHVCAPAALHEEVAVAALKRGVHAIVEKPLTGYFGPPGAGEFLGDAFPKEAMRQGALASARRILAAEAKSRARVYYAENWVFAPAVQKEAEIVRKSGAQILWAQAEESHSGSHAPSYGIWRQSGGGSLMGKGCHPLTAVLYLKRVEGLERRGAGIRPAAVSSRTHAVTRTKDYQDKGYLRTDYMDVEDYGFMHVVFEDGTFADIFSSEIVMGGVHNWLEVFANNHRTRCNINPVDLLETYNPSEEQFRDIYVVEKTSTKQGWSRPAADENWMHGYVQELRDFYGCMARGEASVSTAELGFDTVSVIYSAYLSAERKGAEVAVERA